MSVSTTRPQPAFRIDMLWNDSRYRSAFVQVIALMVTMLAVGWLVSNVIENLARLGKEFSFDFMTMPASYDINQRLIEYTSRSTHSTAAVVGILNTLLVAVLGCTLATVLGIIAGVLRLSKNWLVGRLMTVYVEGVRNIPVLIQILLFSAILDEILPHPKKAEPILGGLAVPTNRGVYFPKPVFEEGSSWVVIAAAVAVIACVWVARYAKKRQEETGQYLPVFWMQVGLLVGLIGGAFLVAGMPITLEFPELKGFNYRGGLHARNSLMALWLALSIYTGAFIAEIVRAGILAVPHGQTEAAFALGLRPNWTTRLIILPQALRVIIPPLISQYLNLTKNSSLAIAVGYMDVTGTLGGITLNQTGKEMESILLLMAFYLTISLSISFVMNLYNEQVKLIERTSATGTGLSLMTFLGGLGGRWELLKKGDARMQPLYGVRGWLNLVVLLYAATFIAFLYYVFIDPNRESYWLWDTATQLVVLGITALSGAAMVTCLFKNYRFIDLAAAELVLFVIAVLIGVPLGEVFSWMLPGVDGTLIAIGGIVARIAVLAYTVLGQRPNVTFFHRVREGTAS